MGEGRESVRSESRLSVPVTDGNPIPGGPPSPCVRNCCLDDEDVCLGCHRTLSEICGWHKASSAEKTEILVRCEARHEARQRRMRKLD